MVRAERHRVYPSIARRVPRTRQRALSRILNLTINVNKLNPLRAGCHIEMPREIATKREVINVRTTDNACFAWSVVAALYPTEKYTERESSYPHHTTVLNLTNIEFPMTLKDISKFERGVDQRVWHRE